MGARGPDMAQPSEKEQPVYIKCISVKVGRESGQVDIAKSGKERCDVTSGDEGQGNEDRDEIPRESGRRARITTVI